MAKHHGDLGQLTAVAEHLGRRGVSQPMGTEGGDSRTLAAGVDDRLHPSPGERDKRRVHAKEERATGQLRPATAQVVSDRLADVHGQRERLEPASLAANDHFTSPPIDVGKLRRSDLSGAEAESREQDEDGEVPPARHGVPVAALKEPLDGLELDRSGQRRAAPVSHGRHGANKRAGRDAADVEETEQRAQ